MAAKKGNLYALGNNGGRPPKYDNAEDLEAKIVEYFDSLIPEDKTEDQPRPLVTGLALFLGFASKQSLYDYIKKEEFAYPIKRALTIVECSYEYLLESRASTGAIFALKNMDWKDKTEVDTRITETKQVFKIGDKEIEL